MIYIDDEPHGSRKGLYEGVDIKGEGGYKSHRPAYTRTRDVGMNGSRARGT